MFYQLLALGVAALLWAAPQLYAVDRTAVGERTALDRYVHAPDTNYSYRLANTIKGDGYTAYMIDMTSQSWLTTNEVNRTLWQHWLTILKPDTITSSTALLMIGGGSQRTNPPSKPDTSLVLVAGSTKSVVAELRNVPNQPLIFAGETKGRSEDSLIAYTWDKFLRTGDEKWPARLPMTKAAVRALDTSPPFVRPTLAAKSRWTNSLSRVDPSAVGPPGPPPPWTIGSSPSLPSSSIS